MMAARSRTARVRYAARPTTRMEKSATEVEAKALDLVRGPLGAVTRARSGGGLPSDRVQSGYQRIRPSLGGAGNGIAMARSMRFRLPRRYALMAAAVCAWRSRLPARADDFYKAEHQSRHRDRDRAATTPMRASSAAISAGIFPVSPVSCAETCRRAGIRAANYLYAARPRTGTAIRHA